ncbi:MAG: hypothetical protein K2O95_05855, partial [Clostridia bacterium]|nr:hypothetical protein [Clostridia bacterium]
VSWARRCVYETAIEKAVETTLNSGARTADLREEGHEVLGTREMTDLIIKNI